MFDGLDKTTNLSSEPDLGCINPAAVDDADYMMQIEGVADQSFSQHLNLCRYCQQQVAELNTLNTSLHAALGLKRAANRRECLDTHTIGQMALGVLKSDEKKKAKAHISTCKFCTAELAGLQQFLGEELNPYPVIQTPPPDVRDYLRKVIAAVMGNQSPNYAVRGSNDGAAQLFQAEEVTVQVSLQANSVRRKGYTLVGLIQRDNFPPESTNGQSVMLKRGQDTIDTTEIDELGNFVFSGLVNASDYSLEITLEDKIIVIPAIGEPTAS